MKNIGLISLGCEKNRVDAEIMLAKLKYEGYSINTDLSQSDIVIINTCGFIQEAKQESINEILSLAKLKQNSKLQFIVVTGCLAELYKQQIIEELPEVDAVVSLGGNSDIVKVINEVTKGKKVQNFGNNINLPLEGKRINTTNSYSTYLKIAEGCDNFCTYCSIPIIRGRFRSRYMENIINEARLLAQSGIKELNIIAQDITLYGKDIYSKPMLPTLLKDLCKISGIEWIRLLYCYPDRIDNALLEVIKHEKKIVKYIDIPLQHCNKKILKSMHRFGDRKILTKLIKNIRTYIPNIAIRTTFMVGFPGETEEDFNELCYFIKDMQFERMGCFTYSREENTKAFSMPNQVDESTKIIRKNILMENQSLYMYEINKKNLGKTLTVLNEGFDKKRNCFYGRSYMDAPEIDLNLFYQSKKRDLIPGQFIKVKITSVSEFELRGIVI